MTMQKEKLKSEWTSGDYGDFLDLSTEERQLVEIRISVSKMIRRLREEKCLTQANLAERVGSSQSRIARIEAGAADVTLDLLIRVMLAAGGNLAELADVLANSHKHGGRLINGKPIAKPANRKRKTARKAKVNVPAIAS